MVLRGRTMAHDYPEMGIVSDGNFYGYCNMRRGNGRNLFATRHLIITSNANLTEERGIDINDNIHFNTLA